MVFFFVLFWCSKTQTCLYVCAFCLCASCARNDPAVVLFLCSKRSDSVFFLCFSGLQKPNVFVCLCLLFVLFLCSLLCFSCARNDPIVFLFCAFLVLQKPSVFVCLCVFFVLFLFSKRSGCCAFLVLETIRLCFLFVLFWCSKNQTCLYVCAFFCAP